MQNKTSNKILILNAAEKFFVARGFEETKISDIASAVGISDGAIYKHFKSKEELLLAIPQKRSPEISQQNIRDVRSIEGAERKLRKLIWNYLEFLTVNKDYSYILLFDLRSNRSFYEQENKKRVLAFAAHYKHVIVEGQRNKEFRPNICPTLILKMIFGAVDLLVISWLINAQREKPIDLFEPFCDFLIHAIANRGLKPKPVNKRTLILNAAAKVFADKGYRKARIQNIATLADVGEKTIERYFHSKEELLFALPGEKMKELIAVHKEHINGIKDSGSKLTVLIKDYLRFLDSNTHYSSIILFELRYRRYFYDTPAYLLFRDFARLFYDVIRAGIQLNHFREDVNPYIVVQMIFGVIDHSLLTWHLFKKPETMMENYNPICDIILTALTNGKRT